jgi:hypothetical protein
MPADARWWPRLPRDRRPPLIKVRVAGDDRDERRAMMQALCTQLAAAPVQIIGKQLILYRPASMEDAGGTRRIAFRALRPQENRGRMPEHETCVPASARAPH